MGSRSRKELKSLKEWTKRETIFEQEKTKMKMLHNEKEKSFDFQWEERITKEIGERGVQLEGGDVGDLSGV